MDIKEFFLNYGISIKSTKLFKEALTHNSYANENHLKETYQRLEFLGDAILETHVSLFLYHNFTDVREGLLTKYRSIIVREETLAMVANKIGLGTMIRFGQGELKSHGWEKPSILADVFEAITAAIYLELGHVETKKWLDNTLFKEIEGNPDFFETIRDSKSELQELLQAENRNDLKYIVINERYIEENNKIEYEIAVKLDDVIFGIGKGFSKQQAEQEAAKDCLKKMKKT